MSNISLRVLMSNEVVAGDVWGLVADRVTRFQTLLVPVRAWPRFHVRVPY